MGFLFSGMHCVTDFSCNMNTNIWLFLFNVTLRKIIAKKGSVFYALSKYFTTLVQYAIINTVMSKV